VLRIADSRTVKETFVMPRALWNGKVIAESDTYEVVEGNIYFPRDAVRREYLKDSPTHTVCGWKGIHRGRGR
jgi:uncharacterized protein (DUF427 family)